MIKPKPEDLLARIAAALDETVLPTVADGPARRQLQAATAVLRRLAYALPRRHSVIAEDTADLEKTMYTATAVAGESPPNLEDLDTEDRNLALQAAMADLQMRLPTLSMTDTVRDQVSELLDGYYDRTVKRDLSLNPPGKDRSNG